MIIQDLQLLEIFKDVAKELSFSKTANNLNTTQSFVSKKISQLEASLKVTLFNRTTRSVSLTRNGKILLDHAEKILKESELLGELFEDDLDDHKITGQIRLSAPETYANARLVPIISAFRKAYPLIEVELILSNDFLNFNQSNLDLTVRIGQLKDSTIKSVLLEKNEIIFCASAQLKKKIGARPSLSDLKNFSPMYLDMHADYIVKPLNKKVQQVLGPSSIRVNSGETINQFCINSHGVALRSLWDIERHIKDKKLYQIEVDAKIQSKSKVYLLYPSQDYMPRKLRLFIDFIKSYY